MTRSKRREMTARTSWKAPEKKSIPLSSGYPNQPSFFLFPQNGPGAIGSVQKRAKKPCVAAADIKD